MPATSLALDRSGAAKSYRRSVTLGDVRGVFHPFERAPAGEDLPQGVLLTCPME
jgi:hypothetical protein